MSKQYPRYCIKMRWNSIWNAPILLSRKLRYKIRRTNKSLYLIRLIFHRFIGCRNLFSEIISIKLHRRAIRFTDFVYSSFIEGQIFRTIKSLYLIAAIFLREFFVQQFILRMWFSARIGQSNSVLQIIELFLDREIKLKNMHFEPKLSKLEADPENLQIEQIGSAFI